VDYVSKTIIHLSRQEQLQSNIFHIVSPHERVPMGDLGRIMVSLGYKMKLLPYVDWRDALIKEAKTSSKNALFPLAMTFTKNPLFVPAFDCQCTLEALQGAQIECPEISTGIMATYLRYFRNSGFLVPEGLPNTGNRPA
jgi:hypothetical protein